MKYTEYQTSNGDTYISKTSEDGTVSFIPNNPDNSDYQAYLAYVANGNTLPSNSSIPQAGE